MDQLNIHIGMEVFIFTEVNGSESQERGTVKFIGEVLYFYFVQNNFHKFFEVSCLFYKLFKSLKLSFSPSIVDNKYSITTGRIPGELPTNDIYAGIELVNPVGNGRGVFNRKPLFKTKLHHAALVPLSGILPANPTDHTPSYPTTQPVSVMTGDVFNKKSY